MVAIAIANGALRQAVFLAPLGDQRAHQLSTVTLLAVFAVYVRWLMLRWRPTSRRETVTIGIAWVVLTVLFEFGLGRALGREWAVLLADYNVFAGRLWLLVPIWILVAPTLLAPRSAETLRGSVP